MNVAVIPARGGSKRLPGKNIRLFAGRPMIAYSIECALSSGVCDRVLVSTDDESIARIAVDSGAEVPFQRPDHLSDDHSTITDVVSHATQYLVDHGAQLDAVCCIYATAPFIDSTDVRSGLEMLRDLGCQYVFSATTFAYPVFRAFQATSDGVEMIFPEHFNTRSQDLPVALHDAAQFCWGLPSAWLSKVRVFGPDTAVVEVPRWRVQDIDTEEDWSRAESMATYVQARGVR